MAKVLGESGRYVSDAAEIEQRKITRLGVGIIAVLGVIEGIMLASFLPAAALSPPWSHLIAIAGFALLLLIYRWTDKRLQAIDRRRTALRRGTDGEDRVAHVIGSFPEAFYVIHDLATSCGNLDHVVVGPTGVYILDAKSWRGVVSSASNGELLVNGKPTDKPCVRAFTSRMLGVREKVRLLAPGLDPFYHAAFVFTAARVEAKWGTTGTVHCLRDDQLYEYIVENRYGKRLSVEDVRTLAQAFLSLAHMERDFTEHSEVQTASRPPYARQLIPARGQAAAALPPAQLSAPRERAF